MNQVAGAPLFHGSDYDPEFDEERLKGQIAVIFKLMKVGGWWTLKQIADATKVGEASVSAQLRNLRKEQHGSHTIEKRNAGGGLFQYRLLVNPKFKLTEEASNE